MRALATTAPCLLLTACASVPATPPCPPSRGWHAWIDIMPGPREDLGLFVSGEVDLPAGFKARLKPGPIEKSLPPGQPFTLEMKRGGSAVGTTRIVTGRVRSDHPVYREILVGCDDMVIAAIDGNDIETAD